MSLVGYRRKNLVLCLMLIVGMIMQQSVFVNADDTYEFAGNLSIGVENQVEDGEQYLLTVESDGLFKFELDENIMFFTIAYENEDGDISEEWVEDGNVVELFAGIRYRVTCMLADEESDSTVLIKPTTLMVKASCYWGSEDSPVNGVWSGNTYMYDDTCKCILNVEVKTTKDYYIDWYKQEKGSKSWSLYGMDGEYLTTSKDGAKYKCVVSSGEDNCEYLFEPDEYLSERFIKEFVPADEVDERSMKNLSEDGVCRIDNAGWIMFTPQKDGDYRMRISPKLSATNNSTVLSVESFRFIRGAYEDGYVGQNTIYGRVIENVESNHYLLLSDCKAGESVFLYVEQDTYDGQYSGAEEVEVSVSSKNPTITAEALVDESPEGDYVVYYPEDEHIFRIEATTTAEAEPITYVWYCLDENNEWNRLEEESDSVSVESGSDSTFKCVVSDGNETLEFYFVCENSFEPEYRDFIPAEDVDAGSIRDIKFGSEYVLGNNEVYSGIWFRFKTAQEAYKYVLTGTNVMTDPDIRLYIFDKERNGYELIDYASSDGFGNGTFAISAKLSGNDYCYVYVGAFAGDEGGRISFTVDRVENSGINGGRIFGNTRYETSFKAATEFRSINGDYDTVVVASGSNFPDALSGCYLAEKNNAPMLLVGKDSATETKVTKYIRDNLEKGGKVYILGGTAAVSGRFETSVEASGYNVERLAGANRYETNIRILEEAEVEDGSDLIVCTGTNYADSLSASSTGKPVLMVGKTLTSAQEDFLKKIKVEEIVAVGGEGVVDESVVNAVKKNIGHFGKGTRVYGKTRFETSVEIAKKFFGSKLEQPYVVLVYGLNFPDGLSGGPIAYSLGVPLILVSDSNYKDAAKYCTNAEVYGAIALGGPKLVSDKVIRAMEANAPEI